MTNWPYFDQDQIEAAVDVLRSGKVNYWTGTQGRCFEKEFSSYVGVPHATAVANGTLAIELALRSLGIGPGDEVVVTPRSFIASVSPVVLLGARPVFCDVDSESQNMTVETIEPHLSPKTKAIIPVHLGGWPCDMSGIMNLAREHGAYVIEDCAQATGATIDEKVVGSFGDVAAFSFCQDKILSTGGEGGMLLTSDEAVWEAAWSFKDHGKDRTRAEAKSSGPEFRYVHDSFGSNYRLTEVQAAIGRVQLKCLPDWLEIRKQNASIFHSRLEDIGGVRTVQPPEHVQHAYYRYYCFIEPEALRSGCSRCRVLGELADAGVRAFSGSCPEIYLERAFDRIPSSRPGHALRIAKKLGETSIAFLVDPTVTQTGIHEACDRLSTVMSYAVR